MHIRGTIFHHPKLKFHNGNIGNKYLILLNTPQKSDSYFFVKTTSQKKNKPSTPGCIERFDAFFIDIIPNTVFSIPTWVQLYEKYIFDPNYIKNSKDLKAKNEPIGSKLVDEIVNCLLLVAGQDLSSLDKKLLLPPIEEHKRLLAEKFSQL